MGHTKIRISEFAQIQRILKQGMSAIKFLGLVPKRFLFMIRLQNQHPKETGPMVSHETLGKFEKKYKSNEVT